MTNREAIEILKELWRYSHTSLYTDAEIRAALDMAILALEEIEQELYIIDEINKLKKIRKNINIYEILDIIKKYIKEDAE